VKTDFFAILYLHTAGQGKSISGSMTKIRTSGFLVQLRHYVTSKHKAERCMLY